MKKVIPNLLTLLRILFVPVFIWFCFLDKTRHSMIWATGVFILASITDYFDGLLARKFNAITSLGKIMDPLADKLLVLSALAVLTFKLQYVSLFLFTVIAFREVLVSILREIFAARQIFIPANIWGKIKTVVQMVGIILTLVFHSADLLFDLSVLKGGASVVIMAIFSLVAFLTIFSGLIYFFNILRRKF